MGAGTITVLFGPAASTGYRVVATLLGIPFALLSFGFGVFCARMGIGSRGRRVVVEGSRLTASTCSVCARQAAPESPRSICAPGAWFAGTTLWTPLVSPQEGKDFWLDALLGRWASRPRGPCSSPCSTTSGHAWGSTGRTGSALGAVGWS